MIDHAEYAQSVINSYYKIIKARFSLTARESEVLKKLTYLGPSNRELGVALHISEKTMKNHIANIQEKTNTRSTRELQALIFRETFIPLLVNFYKPTDSNRDGGGDVATATDQLAYQIGQFASSS
jgi:DNA-binding CsgD family transcriptional regulator